MVAYPRKIEEEELMELGQQLPLRIREVLKVRVVRRVKRRTTEVIVPVRPQDYLLHELTGYQRLRTRHRLIISGRGEGGQDSEVMVSRFRIVKMSLQRLTA